MRVILMVVIVLTTFGPARAASRWHVDQAQSSIGFSFVQLGAETSGRFGAFDTEIVFDPESPTDCGVVVIIDAASISTDQADRDALLRSSDFFDVAQYPTARFESKICRQRFGYAYEAEGDLTIRGVSRDVLLPFTLKIDGDPAAASAHAEGTLIISRKDFGIGQGQWLADSVVGDIVRVRFDIHAMHDAP